MYGSLKVEFFFVKKKNQKFIGTRGYPWVSKYPWITRIEIPARIWGRVRVPYLSNGAETDIILPVPADTH